MTALLTTCLTSLIGTGFFNTLLRAFHASHEAGLARLAENHPRFERHLPFYEKYWQPLIGLTTLLAGSLQILNIGCAFLIFANYLQDPLWQGAVFLGVYGLGNILLSRTLPVILAEHYADRISIRGLPLQRILYRILFPLAHLLAALERVLHLRLASETDDGNRPTAGDEILTLVEQTKDHELDDHEREFIRSALEFGETITREIMTPRVKMFGLEDTLTVSGAIAEIKDSPYSRFPLFHEDYDEVLGMVHVKDLIQAIASDRMEDPVKALMHPASFIPESMPIRDLLRMMKQQKIHTAIAVDEYGGTAGIVTLEDILEELVGEIEDEHDLEDKLYTKVRDGVYEAQASLPVDQANEELGLDLPEEEDYDTVAGYILATLGRIPSQGESLYVPGAEIRIQAATSRQITMLMILPEKKVPETQS